MADSTAYEVTPRAVTARDPPNVHRGFMKQTHLEIPKLFNATIGARRKSARMQLMRFGRLASNSRRLLVYLSTKVLNCL